MTDLRQHTNSHRRHVFMTDSRLHTQRCEHCPRVTDLHYSRTHDVYLCEECIDLPAPCQPEPIGSQNLEPST